MLFALLFAARPWRLEAHAARDSRLEFCGEVIGHLNGRAIHAAVRYRGRHYFFERVIPDGDSHVLRTGEILVEPGLLYVDRTPSGLAH